MEQELRLDNSREGVVDCEILMIPVTFCSGDTGFLKCFMKETGFVVDELQHIRIESRGNKRTQYIHYIYIYIYTAQTNIYIYICLGCFRC